MKFCVNCGNPIPDGAAFCTACGAPVPAVAPQQAPQPQYQQPVVPQQPYQQPSTPQYQQPQYQQFASQYDYAPQTAALMPKKKASGKMIGITFAVIAVIAVVVVLVVALVGGGGVGGTFESAIKRPIELEAKKSVSYDEYMEAWTNGFLCSEIMGGGYDENRFVTNWEAEYNERADEYGSDFTVSVEITETKKIDSDNLRYYQEDLLRAAEKTERYIYEYNNADNSAKEAMALHAGISSGNLDKAMKSAEKIYNEIKNADVSEGYAVKYTVTYKGSKNEYTYSDGDDVLKVNGYWISKDKHMFDWLCEFYEIVEDGILRQ